MHRGDINLQVTFADCGQTAWRAVRSTVVANDRNAFDTAAASAWSGFASLPVESRDTYWHGFRMLLAL